MSGENQNEDIVKIGTEQGRLESLRSDDKSPKDLKSALQTYRQVYFNEVNTGKAQLTAALGNTDLYQSKESRDYLKTNIAFGLANAVSDLANEGQRIKSAQEEKKEYPTLASLKDGVKSKLSQEKTALAEFGELEGIRKKLNDFSETNAKLSDTTTLANVSSIYSQKQGIVKSIEAIENTFKSKSYTLAGDLQTKLKEKAQKYKDSIEDDLEDCSQVIGAKDEYREAGTVLGMIENGIKKEKKPLSATAYEQYSKELKVSLGEMSRIYEQYNVAYLASASLGIFKEIGANFYPKILSPVEKRLTALISGLEKDKPKDVETKLDPDLQAQLDYDDAQQKVAGFSKELAELVEIEEANKKDDASRLDRKNFDDYSEKVKALRMKYEEFKGSHPLFNHAFLPGAVTELINEDLQAKFINVTEKPFLSKLESLEIRNTFTRGSEIDKFEKKTVNEKIQTIIVDLKAQWQTNVTDQSAFLEPAPSTDEESTAFKDFINGENKLLTFVVSAEAQLNVFLSREGMIEEANLKDLKALVKQSREVFTKISGNRQQREMQKAAKEGENQTNTYKRKTGRKIKKEMIEPSEDPKIRPTTYTIEVDEEEEVTDLYIFSECVEFINPSDPKYSEINDGKGFRFTKDLPEEIQGKMEVEAVLIISSKKEIVQAEMSKQKMEILKTGDLIEVGKEILGEKGKSYFAGVEAIQKGDTAGAIKAFQEYLTLSASFDEEEKPAHEMYIQDAKLQIEALNLSATFYEGMALMKDKKLDKAIPKLREFIETIKKKPEEEQKKCADQLSSAIEIVKQINSAKLSMLIDLKKDMEFVEVRRIVTNGTPSRSLDKDATGVFRQLMLPFVPYDTLTEAEKKDVALGRGGLTGEGATLLNRKINDLKKRIDNGEPVDFENEFGQIKIDLQTYNDKHYSHGGKFTNEDGEDRPDWASERLFDNFEKINSFDAKKREKGFTDIAKFLIDEQSSLGDMKLSMRYSQKYLDKAMQTRYQQFTEDDGGALQKEIRSKMIRDSSVSADINSGALEMYKRWAAETNLNLPKSEQYSLDEPDPASLQMFQKQLFESRLKYEYEREIRKKLTDQGEARDGSALKLYNWSLPHDYKDARWFKPWSWSDYNQDDWTDFKEKTKEFVAETVVTLPIGMGAGSIGKAVGSAGMRMLAREGMSQAAISVIERGGLMALRADAALWKGLSVGMRARLLAGYGAGVIAEGGSLIVMNSIYEGFSSGRTPEFFHMLEEGNWANAAITLTESIGKAGAFRVIGGATQKMFGPAMAAGSTGTRVLGTLGSEAFSGFTGTGIEALSLLAKGQGDQITFDFWAKSLAQNALQSYGTHIAHNTVPKLFDTKASTQKKFNAAETDIAVQRLAEVGIKSPQDLVNIYINSAGEIIFKPAQGDTPEGTYRQPPAEIKIDPNKINIEALPPQIREPLKAKIKEVKATPPTTVTNTPETPAANAKAEPSKEKVIGKEKFTPDKINQANGDQPLKPFEANSPDTNNLIKASQELSGKIDEAKNSEAQRQNPNATPEHQQSWGRAYLDHLTGLYNRNGFRIAEGWVAKSKQISLASFDGDYFGAFNKLKGTVLGDQIIKKMATNFHELQQTFRDQNIEAMIIREGGEEFTVIARDINSTQMRKIMDDFRQKLQKDTQEMIKSLDPNLQIELIQYLQATGKLPQNFPPEHFLTGDRFKLGPIGGSTVGVADVNLSVRKPNDPARVLDSLKRHADHALEDGKNSPDGGRNKTYRAKSLGLKQLENYIADSKLGSTRTSPDQPSQAENLQTIYEQGVEYRSERFDDLGKTRGWENVQPIIESADIPTQVTLQRLLAHGQLTAKDLATMTNKAGEPLSQHAEALLKFQQERLQVMQITDTLTGVQNEQGLAALLKLRKEQGIPVESFNLDIKLKPINENLGHIGGDAYLMTSARILTDIVQNLPRDSSDPSSQKFSSKRVSIFRKAPLDGGGFRLIAPDGTLTPAHLEYIAQQYHQRMQAEFFDKIGQDSNGKSVTEGLLPEWINKHSTQKDLDLAQLGNINIIKESQAKLDSILEAQTNTDYRARPEDFQYTQMPILSDLPTPVAPAKAEIPAQSNTPKIAPTQIDLTNIQGKNNTEILRGIESGEIVPTKGEVSYLIENFWQRDLPSLLENSKLTLDSQQQGRLIDRIISDFNISPSDKPHEVPDSAKDALMTAINKGKIDLTIPEVAQRLASYETGQAILIDLIHTKSLGESPVPYHALADSLLKTEAKREGLEIILDSEAIPQSIRAEIVEKLIQKERIVADAKSAELELARSRKDFITKLQDLLKTDFATNPDGHAQMLLRLGQRDPQALEVLKNNNLETLDSSYITAIIEGRKNEFIDAKGEKITAYVGKQVGREGGVGTAFHTAYTIGGSPTLHFAVIKKPHENRKEVFRKETKGAELAGQFGSPYINKILHAGHDFAIFETGTNVRSLGEEIQNTSPRQALVLMRQVMEAMQAYRQNGYLHGDLKEANVIVIDGPNGREVRVIDNDPSPPTSQGGWFCTPGYYDGIGEHNRIPNPVLAIDKTKYGVWDAYALGAMLSTLSDGSTSQLLWHHQQQLGPAANRILELGKTLKNSDLSSQPDALLKAITELDSIIATLPPDAPKPTAEEIKITDNAQTVPGQPLPLPVIDNKTTPVQPLHNSSNTSTNNPTSSQGGSNTINNNYQEKPIKPIEQPAYRVNEEYMSEASAPEVKEFTTQSTLEPQYSLLDQINNLSAQDTLKALQTLEKINRLTGSSADFSLQPITDSQTGVVIEGPQLVKYLEERFKQAENDHVAKVMAETAIGKEINTYDGTIKNHVKQKSNFIIEDVITSLDSTKHAEIPANIIEKLNTEKGFIVVLKHQKTGEVSYRHISNLREKNNRDLLKEALPASSEKFFESGDSMTPLKNDYQPFNYTKQLLDAGREINARTDLTPDQKKIAIKEKVALIRKEIGERAEQMSSIIEEYLKIIPEKLNADPNYPVEKIIESINQRSDLIQKFRPEEIRHLQQQISKFFKKSQTINEYYLKFKDKPEVLFEMQFGFKPQGKVALIKQDFALTFHIMDVLDVAEVQKRYGSGYKASVRGGSFSDSPIPGLKGLITTIYGESTPAAFSKINIHEQRHNINRAIFEGLRGDTLESEKLPNLSTQAEAEAYIQKQLSNYLTRGLERGKDEILAYMKDGTAQNTIYGNLLGNTYNYWRREYQGPLQELTTQYSHLLPPDYYSSVMEKHIKESTQKHFDRLRVGIDLAFMIGPERLNELAVTPMLQWHTLLDKVSGNPYLNKLSPEIIETKANQFLESKREAVIQVLKEGSEFPLEYSAEYPLEAKFAAVKKVAQELGIEVQLTGNIVKPMGSTMDKVSGNPNLNTISPEIIETKANQFLESNREAIKQLLKEGSEFKLKNSVEYPLEARFAAVKKVAQELGIEVQLTGNMVKPITST